MSPICLFFHFPFFTKYPKMLDVLKNRFEKRMFRHSDISWAKFESKIVENPHLIASILQMEQTGGMPELIAYHADKDAFLIVDCSPETPAGRRSLCYDRIALDARKTNKPEGNAIEMAEKMGVDILTETEYRFLQSLGEFDLKTSSWIQTPQEIRQLGGALFADRRYNHVFVYHNGADSYFGARGFRARLWV